MNNKNKSVSNKILVDTLSYCKKEKYRGFNKHDGLNSPILNFFLGWAKWPRLIAIQGVMRFPINLRPLLLIPKTYNPKGLSLFVRSYLNLYETTKDQAYLVEAEYLLKLLLDVKSDLNNNSTAWGYHYPWQDMGFFAHKKMPNAVVSAFVCESFLHAYKVTKNEKYLNVVEQCINFFMRDLSVLKDDENELCLSYMPVEMTMRVMDVSILIGCVIAKYCIYRPSDKLSKIAFRLINYVVNQQTDEGAWYYTDPSEDSHIRHDNYHTGFILDALWFYMEESGNNQWMPQYRKGLDFYAKNLFNNDGAPKWMSDKELPYDIHGAAQGIITFSRHKNEYSELVDNIYHWTITNMYNQKGFFYYQKNQYFTKKFNLLRWCNGWMSLALSVKQKYE
ncbi:hypothetical protein [Colwellia sp. TT2012]|uniref:hypothetical protein n=1 Tax=Colwellia sp. TT2012 TaxID=1720342 RepID=UPI000710CD67|nr:hypothetical protein [Colwellia sp. TT2012]